MSNKVPKIRFRGFTEDWEEYELGKIGDTYTGLSGKPKEDFGHGKGKYVTYMNVFANPVASLEQLDKIEIDKKQKEVIKGDVFFTTSSETPDEVGLSSVWIYDQKDVYLNSFCFGYRPKFEIDSYYLAYLLRSSSIRKEITFLAQGISRYNISKTKVMEINIPIASKKEQIKIGEYFKILDNLINNHQNKYNKLISIKKSMLEKMFPKEGEDTPEIRFKEFTEPWKLRNLVREVDFFNGLTYSPNNIVKENGTLVLRSSNVKNGEVIDADNVYVDSSVVNSSNVKKGDIVMVVRNGSRALIGKHAQIKSEMNNTVIGAFMTGIRAHNNPEFINALFDTQAFDEEIRKNLGATINQITNGMFRQMKFMFPKPEEQIKIGEYFKSLDNLINQNTQKLEKLKNIKKSLLEKMFV